jgi:hypothetical protein
MSLYEPLMNLFGGFPYIPANRILSVEYHVAMCRVWLRPVGLKVEYSDTWSYSVSWVCEWAWEHSVIRGLIICIPRPRYDVISCKNHSSSTTTTSMPLKDCQQKKMNINQPNIPHFISNTCLQCELSLREWGCKYSVIRLYTAVSQRSRHDVTSCKNHLNGTATTSMTLKTVSGRKWI